MPHRAKRRICFVTGSRAEFGLMATTLRAIQKHPRLQLQIIATGMHLDRLHGNGVASIRRAGWPVDQIVPWPSDSNQSLPARTRHVGGAIAHLATAYEKLKSDIVLVVGDRVEAFAAASAAHLSGVILAHIHGGDRAAGQVDDCLRHSITKLSHVHFPATRRSSERLIRMGEDSWRIHRCGSPGVDQITAIASDEDLPQKFKRLALIVHHPIEPNDKLEARRMRDVLLAVLDRDFDAVVVIHPNNDPGSDGIRSAIEKISDPRVVVHRNIARPHFLGLMRSAAAMVGNSSSGIIEAASFGLPVIDVGPRQLGRERGANVSNVDYGRQNIAAALKKLWDGKRYRRSRSKNIYGGGNAGGKIAQVLADVGINARLRRKLIAY